MTVKQEEKYKFDTSKSSFEEKEKEKIIESIDKIRHIFNIDSPVFNISQIKTENLDQYYISGLDRSKRTPKTLGEKNEFTISLENYYKDEKRSKGSSHLKSFGLYSTKKEIYKEKPNNQIDFEPLILMLSGIRNLFKKNGIKKINIDIYAYYSFSLKDIYYDFKIEKIGTEVIDKESMVFDSERFFSITNTVFMKYFKNKKPMIKEFLYDHNIMELQMFDRESVVKKFSDAIKQLELINY